MFPYEGSSRPSGQLITSLRLLQYGSVLEAYDSANQVWSGRISALQGGTATFSLSGRTTAGQTVELAGTLVYADSSSTMDASWIEPSFYGTLSAQATVSPATTNSPSPTNDWDSVSMEPGGTVNLNTNSTTQVFTADGGSGSYNWTLSTTSFGRLDVYSGESVTYTANGTTGTAVLRVYDTSDNSNDDSTTILFQ